MGCTRFLHAVIDIRTRQGVFSLPANAVVKSSKGQPSTSKEIEIDVDRSLKLAADGGGGRASRPGTADPSFGL
jgi:hypothetical protein